MAARHRAQSGENRVLSSAHSHGPTGTLDARARIVRRYRHFADIEAPGRSPLYAEFTRAVADDETTVDFLAQMPPAKWQPNLLLGAVRFLYGTAGSADGFLSLVHAHQNELAAVMAQRRTQTNEPARCATLLPVLAGLPQPLALLEVGASAGLCLLADHYAYDYGRRRVEPSVSVGLPAPVFCCRASPGTPLPDGNVEVVWRAGLDLSPVDLSDDDDVRWLEALIWAGQEYRLPRLRAACAIARAVKARVVRGDLRTDLAALAAQAPPEATLVVFHTAVLAYVTDPDQRAEFADTVSGLKATWIANESPRIIPGGPPQVSQAPPERDDFLLCVDGEPTAWTDGHGNYIDWLQS